MSELPPLPDGAHYLTWGDLGRLAVTNDNRLLWDGKPVRTERRLTLTFWPAVGATLVTLGTLAQGIAAFYQMGVGLGWWVLVGGSPK